MEMDLQGRPMAPSQVWTSGSSQCEFVPHDLCELAVCPWASQITSLSFSFSLCEKGRYHTSREVVRMVGFMYAKSVAQFLQRKVQALTFQARIPVPMLLL